MSGFQRAYPVRDETARRAWAAQFSRCFVCGAGPQVHFPHGLEVHHIIKGGRSDEPANLCLLCARDHRIAEGHRVRGADGDLLPRLTMGRILWAKRERDPENWNPVRLAELFHKPIPLLDVVPEYYLIEWAMNGVLR